MFANHAQKERFTAALIPEVAAAAHKAAAAGVPWLQIWTWVITHGKDIVNSIDELISLFKHSPNATPSAPIV